MKKLIAVLSFFAVLTAGADLVERTWTSQYLYAHNWPNNLANTEPMPN